MKNLLLIGLNKRKYVILLLSLILSSFLIYYNFFYYTEEMRMEKYEKAIRKYLQKEKAHPN